ncbi:MAG: hypothetical protein SFY81_02520 [Verrucomicrobiota bacterium]|nr:hypothetical protein [Verrucomicrobiota bacterium]
MKRLVTILPIAATLLLLSARAQSIFDQRQLLYSTNSNPVHGVNWAAQPPATVPVVPGAQPNQFRGGIVYGGVTRQAAQQDLVTSSFAGNVDVIDWPRSRSAGGVQSILRAVVGGPYLSHGFDFLFGQEIRTPLVDLAGDRLSPGQSNYWHPIPVFRHLMTNGLVVTGTNDPSRATAYYYSPHASTVYATKAGQVQIAWRTATSTITTPPLGYVEASNYVQIGPYYYPVTNTTVLVSGIPYKAPRHIYWTKGDYQSTGKPVLVPTGVKSINFVYNNNIPETVPEDQVVLGGNIKPNTGGTLNNGNVSLYTSTISVENGFIGAYNKEGRIFMELLGEGTGENTKRQLGVEIVDIIRDAIPDDVTIELGERVSAFPGNNPPDDDLQPSPIVQLGPTFAYQRSLDTSGGLELYATRITQQLTDYQVHWLEEGVGGLRWPLRFVRYTFVWPNEASKYSHYVRSVVPDEESARATAIKLPSANAPALEEQDPSNINTPRAKLTEDSRFYTYLDESQPTLRALIRYNAQDRVAFERVFSWLDVSLKSPETELEDTLATTLADWTRIPPFGVEDFKDLAAFAAKLTAAADPLSAFLKANLSALTLTALADYNTDPSPFNQTVLRNSLITDLNSILNNNALFNPALLWTPRETARAWAAVASSSNGSNLVAVVKGGQIYTSANAGASWTARDSDRNWSAVASSSDGTNLVAVVNGGEIYTSSNAGATWTPRATSRAWNSVASSGDGTRLVATVSSGQIYTSTDSGASWTPRDSDRLWTSVASSKDGTRLVAVVSGGQIFSSADSGANWTARDSNRNWVSVTSSDNGVRLAALVDGGRIYTSTDGGLIWTARESDRAWRSIASSADGLRLVAVVHGGQVYNSLDSGATWNARETARDWRAVASSADGLLLAAVVDADQIFTSRPALDGLNFPSRRSNFELAYANEFFRGQSVVRSDTFQSARVISATINVGDRINPPFGELGSTAGTYFAGYINQAYGDSFNPNAYKDPYLDGFDAANQSAIIPVNAIPGKNYLEVWWFRKNPVTQLRDEAFGFLPTYWPSVIGRYTLTWPDPTDLTKPKIVLASNHGSGPLDSFQTAGSLYIQNDSTALGYNPNEEHALLQGGRAWALRDDLNVTNGPNYSSHPYVLLEYQAQDGRPSMTAFHVVQETETEKFDYPIDAGIVLQAPMPLPLLEKPFGPTPPGKIPHSLNAEVARRDVLGLAFPESDNASTRVTVTFSDRPLFQPYQTLYLQNRPIETNVHRFYLTSVDIAQNTASGVLSLRQPTLLAPGSVETAIVQPSNVTNTTFTTNIIVPGVSTNITTNINITTNLHLYRYAVADLTGVANGLPVLIANPDAEKSWKGSITAFSGPRTNTTSGVVTNAYVEVNFGAGEDAQNNEDLTAATHMVINPKTKSSFDSATITAFSSGWQVAYELLSDVASGAAADLVARTAFYNQITFQDRKGDLWVYRGPHSAQDAATREMQFYYKTLPGFWFPLDKDGDVLTADTQPPVGTITPYLRASLSDDPINGTKPGPNNTTVASDTARGIVYRARWPANAPVLQMAETLTVPKRGLPAIRGNSSMEVLYQQSIYNADGASVALHDPTVAKKFKMFDTNPDGSANGGLNKLPSSIQTSLYRGKTYFPRLAPHMVDRFYFDPVDSKNGSLIFIGEFKNEALGESYLLLNVLGAYDIAALKDLCDPADAQKEDWDNAIDNSVGKARLTVEQETFYPNPAKPGTFTSTIDIGGVPVHQAALVHASELAEIRHSDTAVDSYALTAVGPGVGYVTLVAGQGIAFTPPADPVSVKIIKVVDTLYRGEVKVILSSNPLAEKVTMQQIVDLAGKVEDFDFEWWIASPVDGAPPPVYGNTPRNLLFTGGPNPWRHLRHPLPGETGVSVGNVGVLNGSARVAPDVSSTVVPFSVIAFSQVVADSAGLNFTLPGDAVNRLAVGNQIVVRSDTSLEYPAQVREIFSAGTPSRTHVIVEATSGNGLPLPEDALMLYEAAASNLPQSILFQEFSVPAANTYSQYYLSLDTDDALGAKIYVNGSLVVTANLGEEDTGTTVAPSGFSPTPLRKVYALQPSVFAGGASANGNVTHRIAVELYSGAVAGAALRFNCQVDAYQSIDLVEGPGSQWLRLDPARFPDKVRTILGENADVRALSDNYVISRYKAKETASYPAASKEWSQWTDPALAEGWIKRVLAGINPFNQRTADLFNNTVNSDANILTSAGKRWEGDIALNLDSINDYGLIEIYETVLRRGKDLSINAGISFDPANDALLLAAGYLSDLYMLIGNEARADAANPTIGIGTKDQTYGDIATALFAFKGQVPSLLEEELALLRGRDDFLQPGVRVAPVYNRLIWNYTRGIDSGEVIYALNYNILDQNTDGKVDAADAAKLFPQGQGDAYGHYLTALKGYYSLLIDKDFAWVPRIEAVNILGKPVAVDYQDERKFAIAAAAVARTGRQIVDLTWRRDFEPGADSGWESFNPTRANTSQVPPTQRFWGVDHWAARTGQGAYLNWAIGNSILPPVDPDPRHEGIQKVDRTTVLELQEIANTAAQLQTDMDNAEGHLTPLGLASGSLAFDINPNQVTGTDPKPHFEQVFERALVALNNAVASFDDAKDVTRLMRSEQDSLSELQASITRQEQAYTNALIELYGTPYPDDVGPGKIYKQGYAGPDLFHYQYVETETIEAPGIYTPNEPDYVAKIDIQQLNSNWSYIDNLPRTDVSTNGPVDGSSSDLVIVNLNDPLYEKVDPATGKKMYYIPYAFGSHGFFDKPKTWTSKRQSPGKIQQAISEVIQAHDRMYYALAAQSESDKQDLDKAVQVFKAKLESFRQTKAFEESIKNTTSAISSRQTDYDIANKWLEGIQAGIEDLRGITEAGITDMQIAGLAVSFPVGAIGHPIVQGIFAAVQHALALGDAIGFTSVAVKNYNDSVKLLEYANDIAELERQQELKEAVFDLGNRLKSVQGDFQVLNEKLRILDDAKRKYMALVAEGDRLQQEREIFRQRSAAIIQGFRTRDAAFRIFRNEKLERYQSLFDLSARFTYMAANAYDYETGLLNTTKGRQFINRIVNSRALGVVKNGAPQFAGSNSGDPGLSSVLAEMKADWDVLKGRLGFNNPTAYGTTFSLRTEKHRILPGPQGTDAWKDVLNKAMKVNILEDADVKRYCMQVDPGNGLPVPGLIIEFESTIADGLNFFGQSQQGWDHYFDPSSFATKIFAAGIAFEGYIGMDNPSANAGAVQTAGGSSPSEPNLSFLDPNALGATPGIYLIPVGLDSMRSPALGDQGTVRTWNVEDVTIPLPFNIGGSDFSTKALYQTSESLTEPLYAIRKHASFRPVSTTDAFTAAIYGSGGALQRSQFTNTRLIGRSVWNSKWKLVIPGTKLLSDPDEGLRRFVNSVSDIKLHLVTYSYSGN